MPTPTDNFHPDRIDELARMLQTRGVDYASRNWFWTGWNRGKTMLVQKTVSQMDDSHLAYLERFLRGGAVSKPGETWDSTHAANIRTVVRYEMERRRVEPAADDNRVHNTLKCPHCGGALRLA